MPEPTPAAPYLTLHSETVRALPEDTRAELLDWLKTLAPDSDAVHRVTFTPDVGDASVLVFVTELELDDASPFVAHVRIVRAFQPVVPAHLREHFEPCTDFL
ncbi:hypothetical protein [Actinomadura geliboluensis]|uniref:hypothetical protein n=1 Tax=Actinomadura geliboluensis TaxID=882440 RepID=UPI003685765F